MAAAGSGGNDGAPATRGGSRHNPRVPERGAARRLLRRQSRLLDDEAEEARWDYDSGDSRSSPGSIDKQRLW